MNLVDEEHIAFLQVRKQRCDVAGLFNRRPGGRTQLRSHLIRDDVRQGGLSQSWRASQQNMIQRLTSLQRGFNIYAQVLLGFRLADVLGEMRRAQREIELAVFFRGFGAQCFGGSGCFWHQRVELWMLSWLSVNS